MKEEPTYIVLEDAPMHLILKCVFYMGRSALVGPPCPAPVGPYIEPFRRLCLQKEHFERFCQRYAALIPRGNQENLDLFH